VAVTQVFVGGSIFDGTGTETFPDGVVVVEGDKIAAVGRRQDLQPPPNAEVIDASGLTLMPGMINMHEHLAQPDPDDPLLDYPREKNTVKTPAQALHTFAVRYGRQELKDGVTTVRCCGEKEGIDFGYKEAFDRDLVPGPRVIPSGWALCASPSHGLIISTVVNGADSARAAVRANVAKGAQVIKLFVSGGTTLGVPFHLTKSFLTREEIHAAIDEAHKFDVRVTAHLNGGIGVDYGVEAGIDGIEHAFMLSDKELELVVKSGTPVTLTLLWYFTGYFKELGTQFEQVAKTVRRIYDAGAKIVLGNDCLHADHALARQVDYMTQFGISSRDALLMATKNAAAACGLEKQRGALRPGYDADVIAVGGDPLKDIRALRDVRIVMKAGKVYAGL
jgi:imidazolonepropionase-like amidohydrolase